MRRRLVVSQLNFVTRLKSELELCSQATHTFQLEAYAEPNM